MKPSSRIKVKDLMLNDFGLTMACP